MQPTLLRQPFHSQGWIYEEKIDGYRNACQRLGGFRPESVCYNDLEPPTDHRVSSRRLESRRPAFFDVADSGRGCLLAAARQLKIFTPRPVRRCSAWSLRSAPTSHQQHVGVGGDILDSLGIVSGVTVLVAALAVSSVIRTSWWR